MLLNTEHSCQVSLGSLSIFILSAMHAHLKFRLLLILQLFLPASNSDPLWLPSVNSLVLEPNLSLSQASFVDSATFAEDQDPLFENVDSGIVLPLDDPDSLTESLFSDDGGALNKDIKVAGCSSSETFSTTEISRVRRRDESGNCRNSAAEVPSSNEDGFQERVDLLPGDLDILDQLTETMRNKAANTRCVFFTLSVLPWGVCSSGWPPDEIPMGESISIPTRGAFSLYVLEYYKVGKLRADSVSHG